MFLHHSGGLDTPTPSSGLLAEERGLMGSNSFCAGAGSESIRGELISGLRLCMGVLGDRVRWTWLDGAADSGVDGTASSFAP